MKVSVLIPTYNRHHALAVTLTALSAQTWKDMELVISDQSDAYAGDDQAVRTLVTLLQIQDRPVRLLQNLPRKGIAHQRQFLLEQATGPYSLFLDDDVILEPEAVQRMVTALQQ
ncbi:MAG TPA: glycosyltransferase family A protein, partial [Sphingobacteriaceae bacterium]